MADLLDRVKETVATPPGTGDVAAGVAYPMHRTFAAAGVAGRTYSYALEGQPLWEIGQGVYQEDGTFRRVTVVDGSSGPGVLVDFQTPVVLGATLLAGDITAVTDTLTTLTALIYAGL